MRLTRAVQPAAYTLLYTDNRDIPKRSVHAMKENRKYSLELNIKNKSFQCHFSTGRTHISILEQYDNKFA